MRKLVLGVSLWWPMLLALPATVAVYLLLCKPSTDILTILVRLGWGGIFGALVGAGAMGFWYPRFRKTRFWDVMAHEQNERVMRGHDPSIINRIYNKLCRLH